MVLITHGRFTPETVSFGFSPLTPFSQPCYLSDQQATLTTIAGRPFDGLQISVACREITCQETSPPLVDRGLPQISLSEPSFGCYT